MFLRCCPPLKLGMLVALNLLCGGCSNAPADLDLPGSSAVVSSEPTLAEQLAAVVSGKSDKVQLTSTPVDDTICESLLKTPEIAILQFDHAENSLSATGLKGLRSLPSLIHLRIRSGLIDDAAADEISQIKSLVILNIPQTTITRAGLEKLATLPNLVQLRLSSPLLDDEAMDLLATFPKLKRIHFIDLPITDVSLEKFTKLEKLESLYLDGGNFSDAKIEWLVDTRPDLHLHLNQQHHDRDPKKEDHGPHLPE